MIKFIFAVSLLLCSISNAATTDEKWSVAAFGGIVTASEADLNTLITRANTRVGGITTAQLGNAWELGGYIQRRLNSSPLALQLRPSYFTVSSNGTGSGGSYNYSLTGIGIMPMIKIYILEDKTIKLYMQGGVGWATTSGQIIEGGANVTFNGSNYGFQGGLGVSFCFGSRSQHCLFGEADFRGLTIQRNTVASSGGSFTSSGANASLSQFGQGQELEIDGHDLQTTMSGIQGLLGYSFNL